MVLVHINGKDHDMEGFLTF